MATKPKPNPFIKAKEKFDTEKVKNNLKDLSIQMNKMGKGMAKGKVALATKKKGK